MGSEYFLILCLVTLCTAGDICDQKPQGNEMVNLYYHTDSSGDSSCCVNKPISRGTQAVICPEEKPFETSWEDCPPGTFNSVKSDSRDMLRCKVQRTCTERGMKVAKEGNSYTNTICECDLAEGWFDPMIATSTDEDYSPGHCNKLKCGNGTELTREGNCRECNHGFYKPERGYGPCLPVEDCEEGLVPDKWDPVKGLECKNVTLTPVGGIIGEPAGNNEKIATYVGVIVSLCAVGVIILVVYNRKAIQAHLKRCTPNEGFSEVSQDEIEGQTTTEPDRDSGTGSYEGGIVEDGAGASPTKETTTKPTKQSQCHSNPVNITNVYNIHSNKTVFGPKMKYRPDSEEGEEYRPESESNTVYDIERTNDSDPEEYVPNNPPSPTDSSGHSSMTQDVIV